MRKLAFLLLAGVALTGATRAGAQTTQTMNASITIPQVLRIDVNDNTVTFANPVPGDYDATGTFTAFAPNTTITTHGNVIHRITVHALGDGTFDFSDAANDPDKLVSHLEWQTPEVTWTGLSTTPTDIRTNLGRGMNQFDTQYRLNTSLSDPPGTYSVQFVYTVIGS